MASSDSTSLQIFRARNPLFQQDLFHCILDCLVAPEASVYQFKELRSVFFSLAQTCCTFSEPSLDRLWCKLDSLDPLIRCYTTVLNEERAKTPPSQSEWAIIHRYSYRIRELGIYPSSQFTLHFLRATSLHLSSLTPNLRVLEWCPCVHPPSQPSFSVVFIQRLLGPSLVSLSVSLTDTDDATLQSFLANYPFLCSNLKSISIILLGRQEISHKTVEILSRSITQQEHLERLDVTEPIDDVALVHVAMSLRFKKLALVLHPDKSNLHQVRIPSDAIPFRNLEKLSLEVWDICFVTTLLRSQDQMFRSVKLRYHFRPTAGAVSSFFTALVSRQRTHSLRSINLFPSRFDVETQLAVSGEWHEPSMQYYLTYDTFRPLTSLRHLRELMVDLVRWFSIDDDNFISLIRNWPLLQVLHLSCDPQVQVYPWRWAKYVTFKGLLTLLECCPDLYDLSIFVDARRVPADAGDIVCNPALKHIDLLESPISDVHSVQNFLRRHFPSVVFISPSFVRSSREEDNEIALYVGSWAAVNAHLQIHRTSD